MASKKSNYNPLSGDVASPGKIFIGGLAKDTTLHTFVQYFEKYGERIGSVIMKDRETGVSCESNNVIDFEASGMELSGSVPDTTIGKLIKFQTLNLSRNKITGLPSDMWSISSLKHLILSNNQISGSLPNNIGNFGLLETLNVSSNNLSGEIHVGISSLPSLRILKLNENSFEKK
ncbi:hypothetical protein ACFX2B_025153 [Malus domestica]